VNENENAATAFREAGVAVAQGARRRRRWRRGGRRWRQSPYFRGDALGFVDVVLLPFATYERLGGFSVAGRVPRAPSVGGVRGHGETVRRGVAAGRRERVPVRVRHEEALGPRLVLTPHVADDAAMIFFGKASRLETILLKSEVFLICYSEVHLE
jgi:hypothetical protein